MLLTITHTGTNASEIGYLFYKNPNRPQMVELSCGRALVFYPEVTDERTTIALLLDINPIDLARGKAGSKGSGFFDAFNYVNDRPYVSSSFMSTAISKAFGTAMTGRGDSRQALADSVLPLSASIHMLPCGGDFVMLNRVFEPLGYSVSYKAYPADETFPSWGESRYVDLTIEGRVKLRDLLNHIYVLIPVFDRKKHYWISDDEVDKLFNHSSDWLPSHPEKEYIAGRYLNKSKRLANLAIERLKDYEDEPEDNAPLDVEHPEREEKRMNLNARRLESVATALKSLGVKSVIDIGCGEGRLMELLIKERQFERIAGMDVSSSVLARAESNLFFDSMSDSARARVKLFQGSVTYKDARLAGYDAACVVEVIEHIDKNRLCAFERTLFEFAKPRHVVLTTPNAEYNALYQHMSDEAMRHGDHRFEWTRTEFHQWAEETAEKYGYTVVFSEIGDVDGTLGAPTQMAVFSICR